MPNQCNYKTPQRVQPSLNSLQFSLNPTAQDIFLARVFEEPLVPIGVEPTPAENVALAAALINYSKRSRPDDFSSLTSFLDAYPTSPWNASLLTCLGLEYYNTGHYSKTLETWCQAWQLASSATDPNGKAVADRAVGELAYMYARLGRMTELTPLLKSVEHRVFIGSATEKIVGAREGLWNMETRPDLSFRCGPLALHRINLSLNSQNPGTKLIQTSASTQAGFSLPQVAELSRKLGLNFQMSFREQGSAFVVPSVVHWKVNHYAALVRQESDRYLIQDPTFGNDVWVTREALETETSGYFLIPPGELPAGWRVVEPREGETVWGKGNTGGPDPKPHGPCDPHSPGANECPDKPDPACQGMAVPRVHLMLVSLNINDEPLGYSPPVGPAIRFIVRYNQRDAMQPSTFLYSNLGPKWTFDWLSYITDNPSSPSADVDYYIMGGGTRTFTGFNSATQTYAYQQYDQTKLTRTSPSTYEMLSRNGTKKVFSLSDGAAGTSRKIFLTQLFDPNGNAVSLTYDNSFRIIAITDAIGQVTTISYEYPTDLHKITKITDPFGRFATFEYDTSNRLIKITDVIGITSEITYDAGDFINALTTPYGVTRFTKSESGTTRSLEILYPDGERERVEFNQSTNLGIPGADPPQRVPGGMAIHNDYLYYRNTYYWSKQSCAYAYGDYTKAKIYHWLHTSDLTKTSGILESVKEPLEGRVWYDYVSQSSGSLVVGSTNKPAHVGRVLDDGSTQLYTYEYNGFGKVTKTIDPVGRTFSSIYANNGIDLLEVRQTRARHNELLSQTTYNSQHLPLTAKDAAGQTTTYTYNACGQLLTETNAKGDTTTYHYDANGYRTSVDGPLGIGDTTTWTYDALGRVRTKTDVSGYTLTFDYDDLDRLTKITYPGATFNQFTYTLLDMTLMRDRAGRQISFEYNSIRQMTKRTDSLNRTTRFQWCKCGALRRLTDPMGRTTTWRHDVRGRIKCKEYADGSKVTYLYENTTCRLRQRIDEKLQVTQYNYNRDDTLSHKSYTNANVATPPVAFTYDPNYSRMTSMTDGTGTTHYRYKPITPIPTLGAGQLASVDGPLPTDTIAYGYDELGRRVSTAINGVSSRVTFDAAGRITSATNALGTFNYTYDGSSFRQTSQSYPNGQTTEWSYAGNLEDQNLQRITHKCGSTLISEFIYGRDVPTGQVTSWSQRSEAQVPSIYSFGYDAADQLTSATASQGVNTVSTFKYSYDPAANRLSEQIDARTTHFAYNALNQLTSTDGVAGAAATYEWDAEHRLIALNIGNQRTEFTYDGLGRRVGVRQFENSLKVLIRRFLWVDDEICEEHSPAGTVVKRFFAQGMQMETETGTTCSVLYYYTRDHLNSIRELTDSRGDIQASYSYDPFGKIRRVFGDLDTDFGFMGMLWIPAVKLYLTKFRIYDSNDGRWLSRDLLKAAEWRQGINLYTYVGNDPVNRIDPLGLYQCCEADHWKFVAATIALSATCGGAVFIRTPFTGMMCLSAIAAWWGAYVTLKECMEKCPPVSPCKIFGDNPPGCD